MDLWISYWPFQVRSKKKRYAFGREFFLTRIGICAFLPRRVKAQHGSQVKPGRGQGRAGQGREGKRQEMAATEVGAGAEELCFMFFIYNLGRGPEGQGQLQWQGKGSGSGNGSG